MQQVERVSNQGRIVRAIVCASALIAGSFGAGCASYRVPGMAADFNAMGITDEQVAAGTDASIAERLDRKPLAGFPTNVAVVRVQGPSYQSYTSRGYGGGCFTVVTNRDVESEEAFDHINALPMIAGVAPINRLVLPSRFDSEESLRKAAATVQADMLLIYTFDTRFETDKKVAPLGLISLGLLPDRLAHVSSTASAALIDTRNGYVYGLAEATGQKKQLTNAWNNEDAIDTSRRAAEEQAFEGLVSEFETLWRGVVKRYGPPAPPVNDQT